MTGFQEYASYGAVGVATFVIVRLVLPFIKSLTTRSGLELTVMTHAMDQIKEMQNRVKTLEEKLEKERELRRELQRKLDNANR